MDCVGIHKRIQSGQNRRGVGGGSDPREGKQHEMIASHSQMGELISAGRRGNSAVQTKKDRQRMLTVPSLGRKRPRRAYDAA